jgi:release factor glutamine methyltransferase
MEYEGLQLEVFPEVYEPAEDSFLLAKCAKELRGRILDMGCGCGIQGLACARADPANRVLGVDLNPRAVENAKLNAKRNGIKNAEFLEGDLFSNVRGKFDAIVFNPPYLPTEREERVRGKLNLAFDGGKNGRKVTDRFLKEFPAFLKKRGTLLMIESSLAGIEKTVGILGKRGFSAKVLGEEKFFFERIVAIGAQRTM